MLHNARETMLEITVTGTGRTRVTNFTLVESQPFEHHQNKVFVFPVNLNWHSQRTYALLTLFNNHHHHLTAAWLPFIHVSSQRWGHWHWGWNYTKPLHKQLDFNVSLLDFTSCHIWEEDPLVLVGHSTFSFDFLKWFDGRSWMVTVIKHPLETHKKRMVLNVLLLFKTWNVYVRLYLQTRIKKISA